MTTLRAQAARIGRWTERLLRRIHGAWVIRYQIAKFATIEGFLTPAEAVALYRYASRVPAGGTVLEIGSWKGKSTYCLARGLKDGTVLAIDPFDASGEEGSAEIYAAEAGDSPLLNQFDARMSGLGVRERIRVLQGYSRDFVGKVPSLDLLFIDGDHSIEGCLFDYASFAGALVSGGYLLFHDYYPERPELGPTWVINGQVATSDSFIVEEVVDSLWIGKKR